MNFWSKSLNLLAGCIFSFVLVVSLFVPISAGAYDPSEIPKLENPLQLDEKVAGGTATKKLSAYAGGGIQVVLGIVGSLSLVMFIYSGIRYMLARGNADEAKAAGGIMAWAALGLFVIFGSYIILQFVFQALTG